MNKMDIEDFINKKLTKTGEMPNGDNIYLITENSINKIKEQLRINGVVFNEATVNKESVLDEPQPLYKDYYTELKSEVELCSKNENRFGMCKTCGDIDCHDYFCRG